MKEQNIIDESKEKKKKKKSALILKYAENSIGKFEEDLEKENAFLFNELALGKEKERILELIYPLLHSNNTELLKLFCKRYEERYKRVLINEVYELLVGKPYAKFERLKDKEIKYVTIFNLFNGIYTEYINLSFFYFIENNSLDSPLAINKENIYYLMENHELKLLLSELFYIAYILNNDFKIITIYLDKLDIFKLLEVFQEEIKTKIGKEILLNNDMLNQYLVKRIEASVQNNNFFRVQKKELNFFYKGIYFSIQNEFLKTEERKYFFNLFTVAVKEMSEENFEKLIRFKDTYNRNILHEAFLYNDEELIKVIFEKSEEKNINSNYNLEELFKRDSFGYEPRDYADIIYLTDEINLSDNILKEYENIKTAYSIEKSRNKTYSFFFTPSILDNILNLLYSVEGIENNVSGEKSYPENLYEEFKENLNQNKSLNQKGYSYKYLAKLTDRVTDGEERSLRKLLQTTINNDGNRFLTMLERMGYSLIKLKNKSQIIQNKIKRNYTKLKPSYSININCLNENIVEDIKRIIIEVLYFSLKKSLYLNLKNNYIEIKENIDIEEYEKLSFKYFKNVFNVLEWDYSKKLRDKNEISNSSKNIEFLKNLKNLTKTLYGEDIVDLYMEIIYIEKNMSPVIKEKIKEDIEILKDINEEIQKYEQYCKIDEELKEAIVPDTLGESNIYFLKGKGYAVSIFITNPKLNLEDFE